MHTLPLKVDNRLYRGPKPGIKKILQLKKLGVTQVIDLMRNEHKKEKWLCSFLGMKYIHISSSILHGEFLREEHITTAIKAITEHDGISYVHCGSGAHRTGLVCAGYDMLVNKKSLRYALDKDVFDAGYYSAKNNPSLYKSKKKKAKAQFTYDMITKQLKIFHKDFAKKNIY